MTPEELSAILPNAGPKAGVFAGPLTAAMDEFEINTPLRQAPFIANVGHESAHLTRLVENLNYSAQGLLRIFPKYFTGVEAAVYARKPEKIANRVYANRMGNGDEASGDGWRHRGMGLIQTTGADNQRAVADHFEIPFEEIGLWLQTPEGAARSAAFFWSQNGLNEISDRGDIKLITRRINGGLHGLAERVELYERAQQVLV